MHIVRIVITSLFVLAAAVLACQPYSGIEHSDYGDCRRQNRHVHNDHVFIADYHDHALCEWLQYE